MTIQISVVIWTILCFLLLMLILDSLLFRPVLALLDKRRERIRNAAARKAEYERQEAENAALREERKAALEAQQQKQIKDGIERIRSDGRARMEQANQERLRQADEYRAKAEGECDELLSLLSRHADDLAASFAESLVKVKP